MPTPTPETIAAAYADPRKRQVLQAFETASATSQVARTLEMSPVELVAMIEEFEGDGLIERVDEGAQGESRFQTRRPLAVEDDRSRGR
jgi:hypothetical protein